MTSKHFYVTTPIYYVNDVPHIGHAYCTVAADVIARYKRLSGYDVLFLTGADEHGQKVEKAAKEHGLPVQEYVDKMIIPFKELWNCLNISNDDFIRTTEPRHEKVVQTIFQKLYDQGDIYQGVYEGWYCIHEETFCLETQLLEGKLCPECKRPVEWLKEESYYFKTSKYQDELLKHIEDNPGFIQPDIRRNEVVSFIKGGVQDVCVSRTTFKWGVPVPFDAKHVVYVWFDALINYLTGCGYLQDESKFKKFWPADVHLIGKDIIKFHAVIWPSMLMALGVGLPRQIFAHGFWTLGEEKISKSKGIVIDPNELASEFSVDAIRFFFMREISLGADGEFSRDALIRRINSDLANDLGNLLHRTLPMMQKYFDGVIPSPVTYSALDNELKDVAAEVMANIDGLMSVLAFREALGEAWKLVTRANKYIDEAAPWALAREGKEDELKTVMYCIAEAIRQIAVLIAPFIPTKAKQIWEQLGLEESFEAQRLPEALNWGSLKPGAKVQQEEPLFPRIEVER